MEKLKAVLKILVPLSIGLFFIFLTVNATSNEERKLIYTYIKNADYRFLFLSVFFGILSHLSRAYRWKFMLEPLGYKPRFINTVLSVLIGYIANLGIPRSGEILRATTLSSYEISSNCRLSTSKIRLIKIIMSTKRSAIIVPKVFSKGIFS